MLEVKTLLQRQADWQKTRVQRTWAEKVHEAERLRNGIQQIRQDVRRPLRPAAGNTR